MYKPCKSNKLLHLCQKRLRWTPTIFKIESPLQESHYTTDISTSVYINFWISATIYILIWYQSHGICYCPIAIHVLVWVVLLMSRLRSEMCLEKRNFCRLAIWWMTNRAEEPKVPDKWRTKEVAYCMPKATYLDVYRPHLDTIMSTKA